MHEQEFKSYKEQFNTQIKDYFMEYLSKVLQLDKGFLKKFYTIKCRGSVDEEEAKQRHNVIKDHTPDINSLLKKNSILKESNFKKESIGGRGRKKSVLKTTIDNQIFNLNVLHQFESNESPQIARKTSLSEENDDMEDRLEGQEVKIIAQIDNWFKINFEDDKGWISKNSINKISIL